MNGRRHHRRHSLTGAILAAAIGITGCASGRSIIDSGNRVTTRPKRTTTTIVKGSQP